MRLSKRRIFNFGSPLRCPMWSWSRTTAPYPCTSSLRTQTKLTWLTTRRCTIFASGLWSWPLRPSTTWTTWCRPPCLAWPRASASPANSTPTSASWPWTWCRSPACTSSCRASRPSRPAALSSTGHWVCRSLLSRCLTLRIWCALVIPDTGGELSAKLQASTNFTT